MGKGWGDGRVGRDEAGGRLAGGRESVGTIVGGGGEGGGVGAQGGSGVILKREGKGVCWEIRTRFEESFASASGERVLV